jgi:Uma2 family endonuclease
MLDFMSDAPRFSIDDLLALGSDVRSELIDGEIVPKAMGGPDHAGPQTNLAAWVHRRFHRKPGGRWPGGWRIAVEVHVIYKPDQAYCHDIVGWRAERFPEGSTGWMTVSPDWACEVLSEGHEKRDLVDKLQTLRDAGVPHYWVIDRVKRLILAYRLTAEGYVVRPIDASETLRIPPFEVVELRSGVIFGDGDDEE